MRTLVVADIHSNWPALAAIREPFDQCICLGDIVEYGTDPVPCIDWVMRHATEVIRGNHDHAVAQFVPARDGGGFRRLASATRGLHWDALDAPRIRYLARLPVTRYIDIDGLRVLLVHATPRDALDEYLGPDADAWAERLVGIEADLVCVGHTHQPFHLKIRNQQVLNPGSVGQPRDGDPRASYALIENGRIELRRVEYDIDATLRQMAGVDVAPWVRELSAALLKSGGALSKDDLDAYQ